MRAAQTILTGLGLLALCVPADARCLANRRPIEGQLSVMREQGGAGQSLKGYQIQLAHPACAMAVDLDGAPVQLQGVRTVQILTSDAAGEQKLDSLIGEHIVVAGYVDVPDPQRHTGDAVLSNAWLVAVPSTGGAAVAADDGQPDEADTAAVTAPARTEIATLAPDGTETAYAPPPNADRNDIEARLGRFVTEFYLSGDNVSPDVLRGIYARKVSYYGKTVALDQVVKSKLTYFGRWPAREFTLQPGTLAIRPSRHSAQVYELTFVYDFKVASATKKSAGTGYSRLLIDLADGRGKIVRESGKVIDRY